MRVAGTCHKLIGGAEAHTATGPVVEDMVDDWVNGTSSHNRRVDALRCLDKVRQGATRPSPTFAAENELPSTTWN
jgi:hypothetical protein